MSAFVWLLIVVAVSAGPNNMGTTTIYSHDFATKSECLTAGNWIVRTSSPAPSTTCIKVEQVHR